MDWLVKLYAEMFRKIKRGNFRGILSNAKPIYLLALIDYASQSNKNEFSFSDDKLKKVYNNQRDLLDKTCKTQFVNPFFHLDTESFYHLIWKGNSKPKTNSNTPTARYLREHLAYAKFDDELWELLKDEANREYLKETIIQTYLK